MKQGNNRIDARVVVGIVAIALLLLVIFSCYQQDVIDKQRDQLKYYMSHCQ